MSLRPLWVAGRFLSRLPFPDPGPVSPCEAGLAVPWYPFVGLLMGLLIATAAALLPHEEPAIAAALVLILWTWSSGAMHLDGLADSADAWVGGLPSRERTLEIMKDPRSGPVGVSAIVLLLIAKWSGLQTLIAEGDPWLLIWLPLLGRSQLPLLMLITPYARKEGMAADPFNRMPRRAASIAAATALAACMLATGWVGLALVAAGLLLLLLGRRIMLGRIAGFTGDTAGALVEITEALLLLIGALLVSNH